MSDPGCLRLPLSVYPGMSRFVLDWLGGDQRFLKRGPAADRSEWRRPAPELVAALEGSNRAWGLEVGDQLKAWASGETVTIVAGQQVGFGGGPLYTLAKVATLLKMKRELQALGKRVTAFFWLATEDHDLDEVAQLSVPGDLELIHLRATGARRSRRAVGPMPVPASLITELKTLFPEAGGAWLRPGVNFGDSFAALLGSVIGSELILIDSLLPELRRAGQPLFTKVFQRWEVIQATLQKRSLELEDAGYTPQVGARESGGHTLFFEIDDRGDRNIIETPRAIAPERTSTSALTRPLLQDFVLQPDVFVGGPAEVSYYAQLAPLHELLQIRVPSVALRGHLLLATRRMLRFIDRYGIDPVAIFSSPDAMLEVLEPEAVASVKREAAEGKKELMRRIERIGDLALPSDHALARAINRSIGHIEYHFSKLTERAIKGIVRKDRERYSAARDLVTALRPDGKVQDRVAGWFPFWCRHGRYLIDRMVEEVDPDADTFKVIAI